MVNRVILIGRIDGNPESEISEQGEEMVVFPLATGFQEEYNTSGENRSKTQWHRIVAWVRLIQNCRHKLIKGSLIYVEGVLQTTSMLIARHEGVDCRTYCTQVMAEAVWVLACGEILTNAVH